MIALLTSIVSYLTFMIGTSVQGAKMLSSLVIMVLQFLQFLGNIFITVSAYSNLLPFFYFGATVLCLYVVKAIFGR